MEEWSDAIRTNSLRKIEMKKVGEREEVGPYHMTHAGVNFQQDHGHQRTTCLLFCLTLDPPPPNTQEDAYNPNHSLPLLTFSEFELVCLQRMGERGNGIGWDSKKAEDEEERRREGKKQSGRGREKVQERSQKRTKKRK